MIPKSSLRNLCSVRPQIWLRSWYQHEFALGPSVVPAFRMIVMMHGMAVNLKKHIQCPWMKFFCISIKILLSLFQRSNWQYVWSMVQVMACHMYGAKHTPETKKYGQKEQTSFKSNILWNILFSWSSRHTSSESSLVSLRKAPSNGSLERCLTFSDAHPGAYVTWNQHLLDPAASSAVTTYRPVSNIRRA